MASQVLATQKFSVSVARRRHILDGDARTGGHRFGAGHGKATEFPQHWSDDDIIAAIEDVANDPASLPGPPAYGGRETRLAMRNGVVIVVVMDPRTGEIVTGYPV
jgi:hypothetical protein